MNSDVIESSDYQQLQQQIEGKKIAILHDWAFSRRGGERVLESLLELFPNIDVHLLFGSEKIKDGLLQKQVGHHFHFSFLQSLPGIEKIYKWLLPFLPMAIETFDLSSFDFVLSSSHCVAKGGIAAPHAKHVCYLHSPMRYAWDQEKAYFPNAASFSHPIEILRRLLLSKLRIWDLSSNTRVDTFIANSSFVASRIRRFYRREAEVVYPSVDVQRFFEATSEKSICEKRNCDKKILMMSAWVPYKKMTEAFETLAAQGHNIIAAGSGSDLIKMSKKWKHLSSQVTFAIEPSDQEVVDLFSQCHTFVFPAIEDFGIVVVEALAAGLKLVVPNLGGAAEIVVSAGTGRQFRYGDMESLIATVKESLADDLSPESVSTQRRQAASYSKQRFQLEMLKILVREFKSPSQSKIPIITNKNTTESLA